MSINFIDLFAGAGGLSEGFINAGFNCISHVEKDKSACFTLKTRSLYHYLKKENNLDLYYSYIKKEITRDSLYKAAPSNISDSVICSTIGEDTFKEITSKIDNLRGDKKINLIVGGPPCQAYSIIGRSASQNKMLGDERNYLYRYYAKFLNYYKPEMFIFENVPGLLSAKDNKGNKYLDKMLFLFKEIGYSVEYDILNSNDYGVPQTRKRVILVGKKGNKSDFYPSLKKEPIKINIRELFRDLPKLNAGQNSKDYIILKNKHNPYIEKIKIKDNYAITTHHNARSNNYIDLEIYKLAVKLWNENKVRLSYPDLPIELKTHNNVRSFTDRFKVVVDDKPSHTIVAHIAKDGHYYIHPDIEQNRSITPREAARIQTFPDSYFFESLNDKTSHISKSNAFRQIGNAVPPLFAYQIASSVVSNFQ